MPKRNRDSKLESERPVNRIREVGANQVSTAELVACLLQTKDSVNQAHAIVNRAGGVEYLARGDNSWLTDIAGIGPSHAARIQAAMELGKRMVTSAPPARFQVGCPDDLAKHLMSLYAFEEQEVLLVITLNTQNEILDIEELYKGTVNSSLVRTCEVFRGALRRNAVSIIIAHNHPSGNPYPSTEDNVLTTRLVEAGKLLDVDVLDHLVVGDGRWVSMREAKFSAFG